MGKFKIYSYKAYRFEKKEAGKVVEAVNVPPLTFCDVPNWVKKQALFKWALDDGAVVIVESKKEEENTEPSELEKLKLRAKELGIKGYGNLGIQKLREAVSEAEQGDTADKKPSDDKKDDDKKGNDKK